MTLVQHNNRYPRTRFNKVQIGGRFSLGINGTPLVKVSNDTYGVITTPAGISTEAVPHHNGPIFYFSPALLMDPNGTEVFEPEPNPYTLGSDQIDADPQAIEVDPPFFKNQSSYLLSGTANSDGTVDLEWTYPDISLLRLSEFFHAYVTRVILQRSTTTRATPFGPVGDGPVNANGNIVDYADIPSDSNWTTLFNDLHDPAVLTDTAPPYAELRDSYTDTPPISSANRIFHYRLIVLVYTRTGLPPQPPLTNSRWEIDWNSVTTVFPFPFNLKTDGTQPRLSWEALGTPALESLSTMFLNSFAVTRPAVSSTPFATTASGFTMPAADNNTQSDSVTVDTANFITTNGEYYQMAGAGVVRLVKVDSTHIKVINTATRGNTNAGATVTSGKAITPVRWTEIRWRFDLSSNPTNYTLQKRYADSGPYQAEITLPFGFSQPFRDADPPSPTVYYRLVANMPEPYGLIDFDFVLNYPERSIT